MPTLFGSPELAASGDGRLELFVFDVQGRLWHLWQTAWSNGWSDWASAAGPPDGGSWPATIGASGDGRLELFVAGEGLQHRWQTAWSNGWSSWVSHGNPPPSASGLGFFSPAIAPGADGRLEVFVANGALWRLQQNVWSGGWSGWQPHGSPPGGLLVVGPPAAVRTADGRVEVFVLDAQGAMWNVRQGAPGGTWSGWNAFGTVAGGLDDRPAAAGNADGRLELLARGKAGALWRRRQVRVGAAAAWSDWMSEGTAGGGLLDHPSVGMSPDGRLEVFLTAADGNVWHKRQAAASGDWGPWVSEGNAGVGFGAAAPGLGRSGDGRFELFAVGRDGNLWHKWQTEANDGPWSEWVSLGRPQLHPPSTTVPDVFELDQLPADSAVRQAHLVPVFSGTTTGHPWVFSQSPSAGRTVDQGSSVHMVLHTGPKP